MADEVTAERITAMAAAARVPLAPESAERIARAVTPAVTRLTAAPIDFAFETEPASFLVVQQRERER